MPQFPSRPESIRTYPNPKYDLSRQLEAYQARSRRNGKLARLPSAIRDQINRMLDDGFPYKTIIEKLGPAGQHLNEDNLSNWRLGGYRDYLKTLAIQDRAQTQTEAAADLVRQGNHVDPVKLKEVCGQIALLQYIDTVSRHGGQLAHDALHKNPAKMITLLNALSNMSNANTAIQKHKRTSGTERPNEPSPNPPSQPGNGPVQPLEPA